MRKTCGKRKLTKVCIPVGTMVSVPGFLPVYYVFESCQGPSGL